MTWIFISVRVARIHETTKRWLVCANVFMCVIGCRWHCCCGRSLWCTRGSSSWCICVCVWLMRCHPNRTRCEWRMDGHSKWVNRHRERENIGMKMMFYKWIESVGFYCDLFFCLKYLFGIFSISTNESRLTLNAQQFCVCLWPISSLVSRQNGFEHDYFAATVVLLISFFILFAPI